jgi:predicted transcriptional regulator of viral defense system
MKNSESNHLLGVGKLERSRLAKLLRHTNITISVKEAAQILELERNQAAKLLAKFAKKGWLDRVRQGIYMPVELSAKTSEIIADDPFAVAEKLFSPCYIGGMNAANYWDLTEQIFNTVTVMTQKQVRERKPEIAGNQYILHTIKSKYFFGIKSIWLGGIKVKISDPTKTIIDMLAFPDFCGGIQFVVDVLQNYYRSKHQDIDLLINYLAQADNGSAIKRMGFLAERYFPNEGNLIEYCKKNLTKGYVKLSPSQENTKMIRRWGISVPESWKEK